MLKFIKNMKAKRERKKEEERKRHEEGRKRIKELYDKFDYAAKVIEKEKAEREKKKSTGA